MAYYKKRERLDTTVYHRTRERTNYRSEREYRNYLASVYRSKYKQAVRKMQVMGNPDIVTPNFSVKGLTNAQLERRIQSLSQRNQQRAEISAGRTYLEWYHDLLDCTREHQKNRYTDLYNQYGMNPSDEIIGKIYFDPNFKPCVAWIESD